jgi:REP element-mobilizing transposase RayT
VTAIYRRRLPHIQTVGQPLFLTWRLHGSLPENRTFLGQPTCGKAFVAMDLLLDSGASGPLYLGRPEIAKLTVDAFRYGEESLGFYELHAYVVMPNHVHLLITPAVPAAKITHSLKLFTGRAANKVLGSSGPFWQDESYDHLVRDKQEFDRIVRYTENNPVRAGLSRDPEGFLWSSAKGRLEIGRRTESCPT